MLVYTSQRVGSQHKHRNWNEQRSETQQINKQLADGLIPGLREPDNCTRAETFESKI